MVTGRLSFKYSKALSVLELVLSGVVISVMMLVGINQYQKFDRQENISAVENSVVLLLDGLQNYYLSNCRNTAPISTVPAPPVGQPEPPTSGCVVLWQVDCCEDKNQSHPVCLFFNNIKPPPPTDDTEEEVEPPPTAFDPTDPQWTGKSAFEVSVDISPDGDFDNSENLIYFPYFASIVNPYSPVDKPGMTQYTLTIHDLGSKIYLQVSSQFVVSEGLFNVLARKLRPTEAVYADNVGTMRWQQVPYVNDNVANINQKAILMKVSAHNIKHGVDSFAAVNGPVSLLSDTPTDMESKQIIKPCRLY